MTWKGSERRKHPRFEAEVSIYFHVNYDVKTRLKYRVVNAEKGRPSCPAGRPVSPKYRGVTRNVSAEGLCFVSRQELKKGDYLLLEVYLPGAVEPAVMEGEVCWSQPLKGAKPHARYAMETGVKLAKVNGEAVSKSIVHDETHRVTWSNVMEAIFGKFKSFAAGKGSQ